MFCNVGNVLFQFCRLGSDYMKEIPIVVRDHIKSLLNIAPGVRPDANQTIKVKFIYFTTKLIKKNFE